LELLSNIDPEDEFLKSQKSYSLIESVSLNDQSSFSILNSQQCHSDYTIVSGSDLHSAIQSLKSFNDLLSQQQSSDNDTLNLES
jgi:hypothetical protein